jgi:hypothetical protein
MVEVDGAEAICSRPARLQDLATLSTEQAAAQQARLLTLTDPKAGSLAGTADIGESITASKAYKVDFREGAVLSPPLPSPLLCISQPPLLSLD